VRGEIHDFVCNLDSPRDDANLWGERTGLWRTLLNRYACGDFEMSVPAKAAERARKLRAGVALRALPNHSRVALRYLVES
jgi:hypothetical protein